MTSFPPDSPHHARIPDHFVLREIQKPCRTQLCRIGDTAPRDAAHRSDIAGVVIPGCFVGKPQRMNQLVTENIRVVPVGAMEPYAEEVFTRWHKTALSQTRSDIAHLSIHEQHGDLPAVGDDPLRRVDCTAEHGVAFTAECIAQAHAQILWQQAQPGIVFDGELPPIVGPQADFAERQ